MIDKDTVLQNPLLEPNYCRYQQSEWVSKEKSMISYVRKVSTKKTKKIKNYNSKTLIKTWHFFDFQKKYSMNSCT